MGGGDRGSGSNKGVRESIRAYPGSENQKKFCVTRVREGKESTGIGIGPHQQLEKERRVLWQIENCVRTFDRKEQAGDERFISQIFARRAERASRRNRGGLSKNRLVKKVKN